MKIYPISDLARKYGPWAYSKMELAETCPSQFMHKYIAKTPAPDSQSDTKVGVVAHEILEHRVTGKDEKTSKDLATEKNPLTSTEEEMLQLLKDNMDVFLRKFDAFCKAQQVKQVFTEVAWGFTEAYEPTSFFSKDVYFRGKVDLGAITCDNDLYLIDHKSGEARDLRFAPQKRQQLNAYAVLGLPNLPQIQGIRGGINFLQGDPDLLLQWSDYREVADIRDKYTPWLFEKINTAASNLVEPFIAKPGKKKDGWPCHWCNYANLCTAYKEKFNGPKKRQRQ